MIPYLLYTTYLFQYFSNYPNKGKIHSVETYQEIFDPLQNFTIINLTKIVKGALKVIIFSFKKFIKFLYCYEKLNIRIPLVRRFWISESFLHVIFSFYSSN